jgi:Family of unknown function (DUF5317)
MLTLLCLSIVTAAGAALWAGSFAGIRRLRIEWWPLGLGSMAVQLVIHNPPFNQQAWALAYGPAIWVICLLAMLVMLLRNALRPGVARYGWQVAAVGMGLNLLVIVANGGYMPQLPAARIAVRSATLPADANVTELYNVTPIGPDTHLPWLGDMLAEPRWVPMANVVSVGDLILSLGVAGLALLTVAPRSSHVRGTLADF